MYDRAAPREEGRLGARGDRAAGRRQPVGRERADRSLVLDKNVQAAVCVFHRASGICARNLTCQNRLN